MSALVTLDFSSDVATSVPAEIIDKVRSALVDITKLDCHQLNPILTDEFRVQQVKVAWRWERWSPHNLGPDGPKTWWPEFFWLHIGVDDTIDLAWRHQFVGLQEFEPRPLQPPIRLELAVHYEWWMTCYDDYGDGGEQKRYLHMPIQNKRGGWMPGANFTDALMRLAKRRIGEAHEYLIPGYREAEEEMPFSSFRLSELMDKIKVPTAA